MKTQLRIGNLVHYHMVDKYHDPSGWDEVNVVDAQDLLWLSENDNDGIYKPIPLTEEWLVRMGFEKQTTDCCDIYRGMGFLIEDLGHLPIDINWSVRLFIDKDNTDYLRSINSIHQLQNLYHALTGEELPIEQGNQTQYNSDN